MENKKGSGIFLGVIGVATLLVAIIGATFAYFSATIEGTPQTLATGAVLKLGFKDDITKLRLNLIPSASNIAAYSVENAAHVESKGQCKDDNNNDICSVYDFTIGNPSFTTSQKIYGTMTSSANELPDLKFKVYLVENVATAGNDGEIGTDDDGVAEKLTEVISETAVPAAGASVALTNLNQTLLPSSDDDKNNDGEADSSDFVLTDPTTYTPITGTDPDEKTAYNVRTYRVVLWIKESGSDQTDLHGGKSFAAGITFTSGKDASTGVTGVIAAAQSSESTGTESSSAGA